MTTNRLLDELEKATREYVKAERKRLENEVLVLEDILSRRTGGRGVQQGNVRRVEAVAQNDLNAYLEGG